MTSNKNTAEERNRIEFSCICFDIKNECSFGDDIGRFFDTLKSNVKLFPKVLTTQNAGQNTDIMVASSSDNSISVTIRRLTNNSGNLDYRVGFYIVTKFKLPQEKFSIIDEFRQDLVKYLVDLKFGKIFVLRDELSSILLESIYPDLNKVENYLRSYIIKNFTITEGVGYTTNQLFDGEQKNKTNKRKGNEDIFAPLSPKDQEGLVDSKMYLIDFDDLGNIIYSSAFGNLKNEDIISRIIRATSLEELKKGVRGHVDIYFKKFQELNFSEKWDYLRSIRHKVAHNGLTKIEEISKAKGILKELVEFLEKENQEIIETPTPQESFQDIERTTHTLDIGFKEISKNELINELRKYEKWSRSLGRDFFGLKNFLYNINASKGYRIGSSWDILEELERGGYLKIDEWVDPTRRFPTQKEIIFLKDLPVHSS